MRAKSLTVALPEGSPGFFFFFLRTSEVFSPRPGTLG